MPVKKERVAKKMATVKATAKKTVNVKAAAKKAVKTAEEKKAAPEVVKQTLQHYKDVINWKKGEANSWDWLFIEITAADLLQEIEAGADNMETCCRAMMDCMLEGDGFIIDPGDSHIGPELRIRYYVDNLNPERRSYWEKER